jgi:acid phosphatase
MATVSCLVTLFVPLSARAEDAATAREQLHSVLWMQIATEQRANSVQTYRAATGALPRVLAALSSASVEQAPEQESLRGKKAAIVMDVDETVLDNTPYYAALVRDHANFTPATWQQWVLANEADGVPGASDFINRARALGFAIIFVTNRGCDTSGGYDESGVARSCPQKAATIDNLQRVFGFRPGNEEVLVRSERKDRDDGDKQARRQELAQRFRIAMLVGDDLNDFIRRSTYASKVHGTHWGRDWFVLANPIYGSWINDLSVEQKYAALRAWSAKSGADGVKE